MKWLIKKLPNGSFFMAITQEKPFKHRRKANINIELTTLY
jgi:hypothetical protein